MTYNQLRKLAPPGYNQPAHTGMLISQWWHQGFLWGWWSYERYAAMQSMAYIAQKLA